MPLITTDDITLEFTNCTICAAKPFLVNGMVGEDYILVQPAIRTQNYNFVHTSDQNTRYSTCFTMIGGFKFLDCRETLRRSFDLIVWSEALFLRHLFKTSEIILTIPVQYEEFLPLSLHMQEKLGSIDVLIKKTKCDANNLKWKYGIRGIVGYGTRWEIGDTNGLVNWGNTIALFDDGKPVGIDFGGGVETLLQAYFQLKHCIFANDYLRNQELADLIDSPESIKWVDALIASTVIWREIKRLSYLPIRIKYILDKYVNAAVALSIVMEHSILQMQHYIELIFKDVCYENCEKEFVAMFFNRHAELRRLSTSPKVKECLSRNDTRFYENSYLHRLTQYERCAILELISTK